VDLDNGETVERVDFFGQQYSYGYAIRRAAMAHLGIASLSNGISQRRKVLQWQREVSLRKAMEKRSIAMAKQGMSRSRYAKAG